MISLTHILSIYLNVVIYYTALMSFSHLLHYFNIHLLHFSITMGVASAMSENMKKNMEAQMSFQK